MDLDGESLPAMILGVTNPFFIKAFELWPNVVNCPPCDLGSVSECARAVPAIPAAKIKVTKPVRSLQEVIPMQAMPRVSEKQPPILVL